MLKLLLCLVCAFALGATMLQLRQQHLELRYQAASLHQQIEAQQAKIWSQQLQIAAYTAPAAIVRTVSQELDLVPASALPDDAANWTTPRSN